MRVTRSTTGFCAVVLVLLLVPTCAHAAYPGANGKLAFNTARDGNYEIYVANADGSAQTRLITNTDSDQEPSWSPDGTKIVFHSNRDGNFEIYTMNAGGSGQTRLTTNTALDYAATWSPDGTKITFNSNRDGNDEIYLMNADGSEQTRLTTSLGSDYDPAWSPDGTKIAFNSNRVGNYDVYVMNADGSAQTPLTSDLAADRSPTWSPDGASIAFDSIRDASDREIYVMNADGSSPTRLTTNAGIDYLPAWSPDGTKIAFTRRIVSNYDIHVMNADGTAQTQVTTVPQEDNLVNWQPLPNDLVASNTAPDSAIVGEDLTYTATATNGGSAPAPGVRLTMPLPVGATLVSATATHGTCFGTSTIVCALGTLAGGESASVTIVVSPSSAGELVGTASVAGYGADAAPANNSATASTRVSGRATPAFCELRPTTAKLFTRRTTHVGALLLCGGSPRAGLKVTLTGTRSIKRRERVTDARGFVELRVKAKTSRARATLSAPGVVPVMLKATTKPRTVGAYTRAGEGVARGGRTCVRLRVKLRRPGGGRRMVLRVLVRASRQPVVNAFVKAAGAGAKAVRTTGKRGLVRLSVRPRRSGVVRVVVPNVTRCVKRFRVRQTRSGLR